MIQFCEKNKTGILKRWMIVLICLLFLTAAFFPAVSAAQDDSETVRVGYYENEVFQEGASNGAVKTGYSYEYYRKLSEYTGWKYEYVYGGFGELYQMLLDGEIDLLAGLAWKEERAELIGYPDAPMGNETYSLVKHDVDSDITTDSATLSGRRIGVLDSAMVGVLNAWLEARNIDAEVITFPDNEPLLAAFDTHAVDILAAEGDGAYGRDHAEVLCAFGASDYYLCVNIRRPDLLAKLNSAQTQLAVEEPNYLSTLKSRYYSVSMSSRAFSAVEREWIDAHDTLTVGYLNNYLPYSDTDAQGNVTGIIKDFLPAMLSELGISDMAISCIGFGSYDEMIAAIDAEEIDAAFPVGGGLYYSEENGIYQSNPVVSSSMEIIFRGEYSEDKAASFAVNENNRMQYYYIRTNFPNAEVAFYPSIDDCLLAVLNGKVTGTTLNGLRASDILRNGKYRELSQHNLPRSDDRCFGVKIGNEGLLKLINRGINILGSDYAQNVSYRYTEGLYSFTLADYLREHMAVFGSVILAVAAVIILLLVRDIRHSKREIQEKERTRIELEAKNTELAEGREALSEALIAAEHANRAKTTFLNNMSHDIRTPMNAIVGFTTLAASHLDDKEQVQDYLGKISVSSQHLLSLINDVLDMSRIESGKITLESSDVHLPDVLSELEAMIQPDMAAKNLALSVDTQNVVHEDIITDRLRLNQILLNILSNAIKFTPDGGKISFCVTEKPSAAPETADFEFRITDTGIGMSEEFVKTVFEAFTRERTSTVSGIQGTGLGMAITKNIVDMMGGTISVSSVEGEGSEFVVDLPFRIGEAPEKAEPLPEAKTAKDHAGKTILLAEDNEMNRMIAVAILEESGYKVEIATDGQEAVGKMETAPAGTYDLILMDIQMPHMDGYEATRQIRALADPRKADIPIVAVTANAFEEDRNTALEVGMNGHLAKPYDVSAILETLDRLIP